ncbi:hypothetical protein ABPG74_002029 [Tetrahymena malaccensis]
MNTKFTALLALFLFGLCMSQETNLRMTWSDDLLNPKENEEEEFNRSIDQMIQSYQRSNQGKCFAKSLTECRKESYKCAMNFTSFQICIEDRYGFQDVKKFNASSYKDCIENECKDLSDTLGEYSNQIYECLNNLTEEELKNTDNDEQDEKEEKVEEQPKKPVKTNQKEDRDDQEVENVVNPDNNKNSFSSLISLILLGINLILF